MNNTQQDNKLHPLTRYYSAIHKRYDLINRIFTFGLDKKWRKVTAIQSLNAWPGKIIDLCCGTGDLTIELAKNNNNNSQICGFDFNERMLEIANSKVRIENLKGIRFIQGDVSSMPFADGEFDCATIAFGFRNLTFENPMMEKHLSEISRILKKRGQLCILESSVPENSYIRFFYNIYLRIILIPLGALLSGDWKAYRYLAYSSANYYSYSEICNLLVKHDLKVNFRHTFLLGAASLIIAVKTG